jgi:hypothetical protein
MRTQSSLAITLRIAIGAGTIVCLLGTDFTLVSTAAASGHYTDKQMTALAERVGKIFWIQEASSRTPRFLSAPNAAAATFPVRAGDSFEIVELVGLKNKNPYYKVKFDSGKEGYLRPDTFLEEFNLTILTIDPLAETKRREAAQAEEKKKRVDWINSQPWPAAAREAALKGYAVPGMNRDEVKKIVGVPSRITRVQSRGTTPEEHWFYPDGKQLIFHQGLLSQTILKDDKKP